MEITWLNNTANQTVAWMWMGAPPKHFLGKKLAPGEHYTKNVKDAVGAGFVAESFTGNIYVRYIPVHPGGGITVVATDLL